MAPFGVTVLPYLPSLSSSNGNSSSWSSLGLEGEACEERMSFSPSDRLVSNWLLMAHIPVEPEGVTKNGTKIRDEKPK